MMNRAPARPVVLHADRPVVVGDDAGDDRQAEARAPPLCREVGQEELVAVASGHAAAGVGDLER